jgi:hypothetical protein
VYSSSKKIHMHFITPHTRLTFFWKRPPQLSFVSEAFKRARNCSARPGKCFGSQSHHAAIMTTKPGAPSCYMLRHSYLFSLPKRQPTTTTFSDAQKLLKNYIASWVGCNRVNKFSTFCQNSPKFDGFEPVRIQKSSNLLFIVSKF